MSDEEKVLKEVYSSFEGRLSFDEFRNKFNSLPNDKWNFARAVSLFQQYLNAKIVTQTLEWLYYALVPMQSNLKGVKVSPKPIL